ncbi:MAG: hypothetical protein JKY71_07055 [Alphaproteobacteria bacterium]|nr:hypothetical protein [Alphaproteobacteria bacterium]
MRKTPNSWSKSKSAKNLLFFVQVIEELLNDHSWDNYRVYTLDTIGRLRDLRYVANGIEGQTINKWHLHDAVEEVNWSIKSDPIAQNCFTEVNTHLQMLNLPTCDAQKVSHAVEFLIRSLEPNYKAEAEKLIIERVFSGGKRNELRRITACYCAYLIRAGYSKYYVEEMLKNCFLKDNQTRVTQTKLEEFFSKFDFELNKYNVYARARKESAEMLQKHFGFEIIKGRNIPKSCKNSKPEFFKIKNTHRIYALTGVEALDPYTAKHLVTYTLSSLLALTLIEPSRKNIQKSSEMFVHKVGSREGTYVPSKNNILKQPKRDVFGDAHKKIEDSLNNIFDPNLLTKPSRSKVFRSLNTYDLAINSNAPDTQLASMWAALEALSAQPKKGSKIEKNISNWCKAICTGYAERNFKAFFYDLEKIYKKQFREIVKKQRKGKSSLAKFANIVLLQDANTSSLRKEMLRLLRDNPLASFRLVDLHQKFATPQEAAKTISNHEKRVMWQLKRIYRARNAIVHSGTGPNYTDTVAVNMSSYYLAICRVLVRKLSNYDSAVTIDQVFFDTSFIYDNKLKKLRELKRYGDITQLLFEI